MTGMLLLYTWLLIHFYVCETQLYISCPKCYLIYQHVLSDLLTAKEKKQDAQYCRLWVSIGFERRYPPSR